MQIQASNKHLISIMPKVSVIIPSYNYAQYLPECIRSIFAQSSSDWEAIIVDDGSTDNTPEVAPKLVAIDPARVKYFRTENKGVTHARNFAVEQSSGEFILPIDADDVLMPSAISEFLSCMESDPKIGFAYSALQNFGKDNNVWEPGEFYRERFVWENMAACTSMWRREFFTKGIKYRSVIFEDWDLWLQILAAGFEGKYVPRVLFKYRIHHQGRNTINKNRYMQSLIEEVSLNPALYNPGLLAWSQNSIINFPVCLNKPTIVFLPETGSAEYSNFQGPLAEQAARFVKQGHFVCAIGDYRAATHCPPGVVLITHKDQNISADLVGKEVYKLGKEVIIFNGLGEIVEAELQNLNNVSNIFKIEAGKVNLPKISVVTVSYNQAEFIRENIETVLAQNYPNIEHLIIDGGSTDGTVEILKSYPHLNWVSEPDRGQTHALNKGFEKASGDIIAWLNSDDYYPEGVFYEVADKLKDKSILIGACQVTGKSGEYKEFVPNVARSWFDVLKYWVFFSSPAQPSIFFKKDVLNDFKIKDQTYLDEGLDFCMDYEFWLRIGKKYPLTNYSSKVLSYCRTYDTNKTGQDMDSVYREMSRVFSRYSKSTANAERALSFVIPVVAADQNLFDTLDSISKQNLHDYDVMVIDHSSDNKSAKAIRRAILDYEKKVPFTNIRYQRSLTQNYVETVNQAFETACAEFIALITPGSKVSPTFCYDTKNLMRHDIIGMALPIRNETNLLSLIKPSANGYAQFNIDNIFACPWIAPCFVARKIALLEIGGVKNLKTDFFLVNSLVMNMVNRGWQINVDNRLEVMKAPTDDQALKDSKVAELSGYFAANIITEIFEDEDEFARLRAKHGFALVFSDEMIKNSKMVTDQIKNQISF